VGQRGQGHRGGRGPHIRHVHDALRAPQPDGAACDRRAVGRRQADTLGLDAIRLGRARGSVQDPRDPGGERARRIALRGRRLRVQGLDVVARGPGCHGGEGRAAPGEARGAASADVRAGGRTAAHGAADRARRHARRPPRGPAPRRDLAHVEVRGVRGALGHAHPRALRVPQRRHHAPGREARPRNAHLPARAGREHRYLRDRVRDGRARAAPLDGPARAAVAQLRRRGAGHPPAVVQQEAARVLYGGCQALRVGTPRSEAALDARGQPARWLGARHGDLSRAPDGSEGERDLDAGGHRRRALRHAGHRNRHLHRDDPGRGRRAGNPDRSRPLRAGRYAPAQGAHLRRLDDRLERGTGRAGRVRDPAQDARR